MSPTKPPYSPPPIDRQGPNMMFMCTLRFTAGHYEQAIRTYKNPKAIAGVKILHFLGIFGDNDAVMIFEAQDEGTAAEFVVQFREHSHTSTSVVFPVESYKWTR